MNTERSKHAGAGVALDGASCTIVSSIPVFSRAFLGLPTFTYFIVLRSSLWLCFCLHSSDMRLEPRGTFYLYPVS